jgi:hypothetical protein
MEGKHHIVVINGRGGVGKDTLIATLDKLLGADYRTKSISAITPVKMAAMTYFGWDGAEEERDRKFLADLRQLIEDYNDSCMEYLKTQTYEHAFKNERSQNATILFVHILEYDNIMRYCDWVRSTPYLDKNYQVTTISILSPDEEYDGNYDHMYVNSKSKSESGFDFTMWFKENILDK